MRPVLRYKQAKALHRVYCHRDGATQKIVYVGITDVPQRREFHASGHVPEHKLWMHAQLSKGFKRTQIVSVHKDKLTREEAINLQRSLILKHKPRFNQKRSSPNYSTKDKMRKKIMAMERDGLEVQFIADALHVDFFVVQRIIDSAHATRNRQGFVID